MQEALQEEHEELKLEYTESLHIDHEKCDYVGEGEYDLDAHVFSEECEQHFTCYHCGRNFQTNADLMIHRKIEHEQKVQLCRNFSGGGCDFKDEDCTFNFTRKNY